MNWNKHEAAFHPTKNTGDEAKPLKSWRGGNLPKLNSFMMGLEEVYHGLFLATQHDLGEMASRLMPCIRRLCDAAVEVVETWENQHDPGCTCRVCLAMHELRAAWKALDNDGTMLMTAPGGSGFMDMETDHTLLVEPIRLLRSC